MSFLILIAGLVLWTVAHLFKRLAPGPRESLGNAGKGIAALCILAGLVLMIIGYRGADFIPVWSPLPWLTHLNNLLMLGAVFLFGMSATTGRLRGRMRHPMLASVKVWALAHLLVNGDLASIVLFGGLLAWAVVEVIVINRAGPWDRPEPGEPKGDVKLVVITLVVYGVITGIHTWLGVWPFGG